MEEATNTKPRIRWPKIRSRPYKAMRFHEGGGRERFDAWGIDLHVGPKGSGKTNLAVHRGLKYAQGKVKQRDGTCVCGKPECDGKWTVFTNIESTWIDNENSKEHGGGLGASARYRAAAHGA